MMPDFRSSNDKALPSSRTRRTSSKLRLEKLEDRTAPALFGSVFIDSNNNNLRDAGESGVPGVQVTLRGASSFNLVATTDTAGNFQFNNLEAGVYTLSRAEVGGNFPVRKASVGSLGGTVDSSQGKITGIRLEKGQTGVGYQFAIGGFNLAGVSLRQLLASADTTATGLNRPGSGQATSSSTAEPAAVNFTSPALGSLHGAVFTDTNGNKRRDPVETGFASLAVNLTGVDDRGASVLRTATTDAAGNYSFTSLRPGTYSIVVPLAPEGTRFDTPFVGFLRGVSDRNNQIKQIVLGAGQKGFHYDFGMIPVSAPTAGPGPDIGVGLVDDTGNPNDNITADPTIVGKVLDVAGLVSLRAHLDGTAAATATDITGNLRPDGAFVLNLLRLNQISGFSAGLAQGVHTLHVIGTDASGVTTTKDFTFTFDRVAPGVPTLNLDFTSDTGTKGDRHTDNASVTLTGRTTAGAKVTLIKEGLQFGTATADATGKFVFNNVTLAQGVNNFTARASDVAGNLNELSTFIVRNQGPIVTKLFSTVTAARNSSAQTLDLSGNFRDPDQANTIVRIATSEGNVDLELFDTATPRTVTNFLNYVNSDRYDSTIFHRLVNNFVIQGGGQKLQGSPPTTSFSAVATDPAVLNEFSKSRSNLFGTIAMAKLGDQPNSATSEWFVNLNDNSGNLDNQNGGFTVFGKVKDGESMRVVNTLAKYEIQNRGGSFTEVPVKDFPQSNNFPGASTRANLAFVDSATVLQQTDKLTYSIVSNDATDKVTASISNNRLTVNFVAQATGTAHLVIRATDQSGASVQTTITINIT